MSRTSHYLTMRDGVRIAVDVHLPEGHAGPYATILHQTRYFRGVEVKARRLKKLESAFEMVHATRTRFLAAGYAWVDVDVRGSGASFGRRPCPWSPDEVQDGGELVDWIIGQSWSTGVVGATGVSYGGTTAEMLLICQHPAVKAIAPRFSLFDVFTDVMAPGGVPLRWFTDNWNRVNQNLDAATYEQTVSTAVRIIMQSLAAGKADRRTPRWSGLLDKLDRPGVERFIARNVRRLGAGVRPVNGDVEALAAAVAEHLDNYDVQEQADRVEFRDDELPESNEYEHLDSWTAIAGSVDRFSPHSYLDALRGSGAAIFSISGWLDGAYQHAAVKRHLTVGNPGSYLLLGPWEHGGNLQVSPYGATRKAVFDQEEAMIRFFDHQLRGAPRPEWAPVRYYTMGAERWQSSQTWPPAGAEMRKLYLGAGGTLSSEAGRAGVERFVLPEDSTSGRASRWRSYVGPHQFIGYPERAQQTRALPVFRSAPLEMDTEITGHPVATLHLHTEVPDGDLFVYLEEEDAGGAVRYITEGLLRLCHRRLGGDRAPYRSPAGFRSYARDDAADLDMDGPNLVVVDLLPVSYLARRGARVRLVLAGADVDNFGPPRALGAVGVEVGGERASFLSLPVVG